jgi:hypothetical protein
MSPLTPEIVQYHRDCYNAIVKLINVMPPAVLDRLLRDGFCPVPVQHLVGVPLGMFHCDICGTMVVAGMPHTPLDPPWNQDQSVAAQNFYQTHPELRQTCDAALNPGRRLS